MVGEKQTEVLAIVPARGGSESIPRKNIRPLGGHPLLAYSIAAGLQAESVGRVIVSTDDEEIAEIARAYGAEVPFMRPVELAANDTPDLPVFQHALEWLDENQEYRPEIVVQLRPTSPLRPPVCVDGAVATLLGDGRAGSVRGVVASGQNPYKMWRINNEQLAPLLTDVTEGYNLPRQLLPETYWQTGHVDAIRVETILEAGSMTGKRILPWIIDRAYAIDIDTPADWERAERMLEHGALDFVTPDGGRRRLPDQVDLVVLDFDGTLTDDRVWISEDGVESVAAHRGDGAGIARLRRNGIEVIVLTREEGPVVAARCAKLGIEAIQGVREKGPVLEAVLKSRGIEPSHAVFVGNDVNDLACFPLVGFAAAVGNSHPSVKSKADLVLALPGGHGAVREFADLLLRADRRKETSG